jgi:hypothetical protein
VSAQVCPVRYTVDGLFEPIHAYISEPDFKSNGVSLPHLIEDDGAAQSRFGREVFAGGDVILNEFFTDRPNNRSNRLGNADLRATVQLSRIVVRIEKIATELTSRERTRLSTAGRSGNDEHDRHSLSPEVTIRARLHIRGEFLLEAVAVLVDDAQGFQPLNRAANALSTLFENPRHQCSMLGQVLRGERLFHIGRFGGFHGAFVQLRNNGLSCHHTLLFVEF